MLGRGGEGHGHVSALAGREPDGEIDEPSLSPTTMSGGAVIAGAARAAGAESAADANANPAMSQRTFLVTTTPSMG